MDNQDNNQDVDVDKLMKQLLDHVEDCRYLAAHDILMNLDAELAKLTEEDGGTKGDQVEANKPNKPLLLLQALYTQHIDILSKLRNRYQEVMETLHYQDNSEDWIFGTKYFGVTTHYKYDSTDHSLLLKLQGVMEDLPLFEQCAVIHEVDLFPTWLPFCKQGVTVDKIGIAELIPYIYIYIPPLGRDFVMQAYGADCLYEHSKLIIIGKSIENYPDKEVPFRTRGWLQDRMEVKQFKTITEVISPTCAKTTIIADVNPNCPLPQALLNMVIKNLAGVVLYFFQQQVKKVSLDLHCAHSQRIRENQDFYSRWLLTKLRKLCEYKGWEQPVILSLGEEGKPAAKEHKQEEESNGGDEAGIGHTEEVEMFMG